MTLIGNLILFALLSLLPCALLFDIVWTVGRRFARPQKSEGRGDILAFFVSLVVGAGVGLLLLGPFAESPLLIALSVVALVAVFLLMCIRLPFAVQVASAAGVVAGSHLAVAVRYLADPATGDGQDAFWVMPAIDLWLIVGVPMLLALLALLVAHNRASKY